MKNAVGRILFRVFLFSTIIACEKEDLTTNHKVVSVSYHSMEIKVMDLVNNYRTGLGLNALNTSNLVSIEAATHSAYMVEIGAVNHDYFDIRTQNLMENSAALSVAENVGFGYKTAEELVNSWLNSTSHRNNIESKYFTDFGISAKQNLNGRYYVTQIFIKRK